MTGSNTELLSNSLRLSVVRQALIRHGYHANENREAAPRLPVRHRGPGVSGSTRVLSSSSLAKLSSGIPDSCAYINHPARSHAGRSEPMATARLGRNNQYGCPTLRKARPAHAPPRHAHDAGGAQRGPATGRMDSIVGFVTVCSCPPNGVSCSMPCEWCATGASDRPRCDVRAT